MTTDASPGAPSDAATTAPIDQAIAPASREPSVTPSLPTPRQPAYRVVSSTAEPTSALPGRALPPVLSPPVLAFFASPPGREFLHRLLLALFFVFVIKAGVGVAQVKLFLELTGLAAFLAHSERTLQRLANAITAEIATWGEREEQRLALQMTLRTIVLWLDEQFHDGQCLTAQDAISGYVFLEEKSPTRDGPTWTARLKAALGGFRLRVVSVCADGAKGIARCAREGLKAALHADVFHLQFEISKASAARMAARVRAAEEAHDEATAALATLLAAKAAQTAAPRRAGRPKDWDAHERRAREKIDRAAKTLHEVRVLQETLRTQTRRAGAAAHPIDLRTGHWQTRESVLACLSDVTAKLRDLGVTIGCATRMSAALSRWKESKAGLAARVSSYRARAEAAVGTLSVAPDVASMVLEVLIPYAYAALQLRRSERSSEREILRETLHTLQEALCAEGSAWRGLSTGVRAQLWRFADSIARTFVRTSSGLEGHNGVTALRHHQRHRLTDADLKALRVVHNFVLVRPDGTTAAQRLFGQAPRSLFAHLCRVMVLPGPPQQGHPNPRREDFVASIMAAA